MNLSVVIIILCSICGLIEGRCRELFPGLFRIQIKCLSHMSLDDKLIYIYLKQSVVLKIFPIGSSMGKRLSKDGTLGLLR